MSDPDPSPRRAIFPGTFDPVTNGHIDLIERASRMFEHVTVVVAGHHDKKHLLSIEARVGLLEEALRIFDHVDVAALDGLLVDGARRLGASTIVRGVRNAQDLEYERQLALTNRAMAPEIDTVLLLSSPEHAHVSSTLVRQIARMGGDLSSFVPSAAREALNKALS